MTRNCPNFLCQYSPNCWYTEWSSPALTNQILEFFWCFSHRFRLSGRLILVLIVAEIVDCPWRQPFFFLSTIRNRIQALSYLCAEHQSSVIIARGQCIILRADDWFDRWNSALACVFTNGECNALAGPWECIAWKLMHGHMTWICVCYWLHSWTCLIISNKYVKYYSVIFFSSRFSLQIINFFSKNTVWNLHEGFFDESKKWHKQDCVSSHKTGITLDWQKQMIWFTKQQKE